MLLSKVKINEKDTISCISWQLNSEVVYPGNLKVNLSCNLKVNKNNEAEPTFVTLFRP